MVKESPSQLGTLWTIWPRLFSKLIAYYFSPQILCHKANQVPTNTSARNLARRAPWLGRPPIPCPFFKAYEASSTLPTGTTTLGAQAVRLHSSTWQLHILPQTAPGEMPDGILVLALFHFPSHMSIVHANFKQLKREHHLTAPCISCSAKNNYAQESYATINRWMNVMLAPSRSPSDSMKNESNVSFSIVQLGSKKEHWYIYWWYGHQKIHSGKSLGVIRTWM